MLIPQRHASLSSLARQTELLINSTGESNYKTESLSWSRNSSPLMEPSSLPFHKKPPLNPIPSHTLTFHFFKIHFHIILQSVNKSPKLSLPFWFPKWRFYKFLISLILELRDGAAKHTKKNWKNWRPFEHWAETLSQSHLRGTQLANYYKSLNRV